MISLIPQISASLILLLFVQWANNSLPKTKVFDSVMRDLIRYFKQYSVRRNCQELKTTFYFSAKESAYMYTYQKYSIEREKYADDMQEMC